MNVYEASSMREDSSRCGERADVEDAFLPSRH